MNMELRERFKASVEALERKGYVRQINRREVYASDLDTPIEALFEEAVPLRESGAPGQPMTRRELNARLQRE
jgi:hypothetical protein